MKIAQIAGFLGSGKTTLLIKIAKILVERGEKIAIIVNDLGEVTIDGKIVEMYGLEVKELSGGCICCEIAGNFSNTVEKLYNLIEPDVILVEPTGVAIPWYVKRAAEFSEEGLNFEVIEHSPVITLVDAVRIEMLIKAVKRLIEAQIREADYILINKVDEANENNIQTAIDFSKSINDRAEIIKVSANTGEGVQQIADIIETGTSMRYDVAFEEEILKREYSSE